MSTFQKRNQKDLATCHGPESDYLNSYCLTSDNILFPLDHHKPLMAGASDRVQPRCFLTALCGGGALKHLQVPRTQILMLPAFVQTP